MSDIHRLDRYDVMILSALQRDGRMTWLELGEAVSLSASAVQRRVRALQDAGMIRRFTVDLDRAMLGHDVHAFVSVNVERQDVRLAEKFRRTVVRYPEVQACYQLAGNVDYLLDVVAPTITAFGRFLDERVLSLAGVKDASSAIVLDTVKEREVMIPSA